MSTTKSQVLIFTLGVAFLGAGPLGAAGPSDDLRTAVEARFLGDRSGACIAAALVGTTNATAFVGTDPATHPVDDHTAFEIGNLSRTMVSALVEEAVLEGRLTLDEPLARLLAAGTKVPDFEGRPITLGQLLDHVSGLPSLPGRLRVQDDGDPFRALTPEQLLGSLGDATLAIAPGTRYRNSTFGMMLLSYALARHAGGDYQGLIEGRLFKPLAMGDAHLVRRDPPLHEAQGHASNGRSVRAWNIPADLAGGGGVRASLTDLVHYAEGVLGLRPSPISKALAATLATPPQGAVSPAVMNWRIIRRAGHVIRTCEGATGGFSSFMAVDLERHQAVVLLSDTALANFGGLEPLGLSLLDPGFPAPGFPRRAFPPGDLLVSKLAGQYRLPDGTPMTLAARDGKLSARFGDDPPHALGYDSAGDFYALDEDFLIHPIRSGEGYTFSLRQGGGHLEAERVDPPPSLEARLDAKGLQALAGEYRMKGTFEVIVTFKDNNLYVQGSNQPMYLVTQVRNDVFATVSADAEFTFIRDPHGKVNKLSVRQGGKTMVGERH